MSLKALLGGAMIGSASGVLLLLTGNIMGASGIASSALLKPTQLLTDQSQHWKLVFLASFLLTTNAFFSVPFDRSDPAAATLSPLGYGLAGLFVGFGTKLSNGCTSGHGICGLARLSKRSMAAVATFMASAVATTYLTQVSPLLTKFTSVLQVEAAQQTHSQPLLGVASALTLLTVVASAVAPWFRQKKDENGQARILPAIASGSMFASGLYIGQMVYQSRVLGFLNLAGMTDGSWDPTLVFVMGGGVMVSLLSYQFLEGYRITRSTTPVKHPLALKPDAPFCIPTNTHIDAQLILGSVAFGIGWGLGGICPGPGIFLAGAGVQNVILHWWPSYFVGAYIANEIQNQQS
jgi:uncharacterized membrane protein YedE/YeeE